MEKLSFVIRFSGNCFLIDWFVHGSCRHKVSQSNIQLQQARSQIDNEMAQSSLLMSWNELDITRPCIRFIHDTTRRVAKEPTCNVSLKPEAAASSMETKFLVKFYLNLDENQTIPQAKCDKLDFQWIQTMFQTTTTKSDVTISFNQSLCSTACANSFHISIKSIFEWGAWSDDESVPPIDYNVATANVIMKIWFHEQWFTMLPMVLVHSMPGFVYISYIIEGAISKNSLIGSSTNKLR